MHFWADWSDWCRKLYGETLQDPAVARSLSDAICISFDGESPAGKRMAATFPVRTYPIMFFVSPTGKVEDLIAGFIDAPSFVVEFKRIRDGEKTLSDLERVVREKPEDIQARLDLARKYSDLGNLKGNEEQLAAVRELDPEQVSLPVRRMKYENTISVMESGFDDSKSLYPTISLEEFLADEPNDELQFQGWSYLASLYANIDRAADARAAYAAAWKYVPLAQEPTFGYQLVQAFWGWRKELAKLEKKLALDVATQVVTRVEEAGADGPTHARALDSLACCYYVNGKRAKAMSTVRRCIELDPKTESYALRLEVFKARK